MKTKLNILDAIEKNDTSFIKEFIRKNNPNSYINNKPIISHCIEQYNIHFLKILLDANADINLPCQEYKNTPLHIAINSYQHIKNNRFLGIFDLLLKNKNIDIEKSNIYDQNSFLKAVYANNITICNKLINAKVNIYKTDINNEDAINYCIKFNYFDLLNHLIDNKIFTLNNNKNYLQYCLNKENFSAFEKLFLLHYETASTKILHIIQNSNISHEKQQVALSIAEKIILSKNNLQHTTNVCTKQFKNL